MNFERMETERKEKWDNCNSRLPFLDLDPGWQIKVLAPFCGAIARFQVKKESGHTVSIYADFHDALGCVGRPYWEVYPHGGDVGRCLIEETDILIQMIRESEADQ